MVLSTFVIRTKETKIYHFTLNQFQTDSNEMKKEKERAKQMRVKSKDHRKIAAYNRLI